MFDVREVLDCLILKKLKKIKKMVAFYFTLTTNQNFARCKSLIMLLIPSPQVSYNKELKTARFLLKNKFSCELNFFKKIFRCVCNSKKKSLFKWILGSFFIVMYWGVFSGILLGFLASVAIVIKKVKKTSRVNFTHLLSLSALVVYFFLSILYSCYSCYKTIACVLISIYYLSKFLFFILFFILFLFTHGFVATWLIDSHLTFLNNTNKASFVSAKHKVILTATYFMYFPTVLHKTFKKCVQAVFTNKFIQTLLVCARQAWHNQREDKLKKVVFTRRNMHRNLFIYRFLYLVLCEYFTPVYRRRWAFHVKKYFDLIIRLWTLRAYDAVIPFFISILAILLELSFTPVIFLFFYFCVRIAKDFVTAFYRQLKNIIWDFSNFFKKIRLLKITDVASKLRFVAKNYRKYAIRLITLKYLNTIKRERFLAVRVRYFKINHETILRREIEFKGSYLTNKRTVDYLRSLTWMFLRLSFFNNLNKSCYRFLKKTPMQYIYISFLYIFMFIVFYHSLNIIFSKIYVINFLFNAFNFGVVSSVTTYCCAAAFLGVYKSSQTKHVRLWNVFYARKWQATKKEYPSCVFCVFFVFVVYAVVCVASVVCCCFLFSLKLKNFIIFFISFIFFLFIFLLLLINNSTPQNVYAFFLANSVSFFGYVFLWFRIFFKTLCSICIKFHVVSVFVYTNWFERFASQKKTQ